VKRQEKAGGGEIAPGAPAHWQKDCKSKVVGERQSRVGDEAEQTGSSRAETGSTGNELELEAEQGCRWQGQGYGRTLRAEAGGGWGSSAAKGRASRAWVKGRWWMVDGGWWMVGRMKGI
jgi:hypothetical protein